jgi:hypothetical protein
MTFGKPSTDDANRLASNGVGHDDEPVGMGLTEKKEAILADRVVRVVDGERERVTEGCRRILEGDAVLGRVPASLRRIPDKLHRVTGVRIAYRH